MRTAYHRGLDGLLTAAAKHGFRHVVVSSCDFGHYDSVGFIDAAGNIHRAKVKFKKHDPLYRLLQDSHEKPSDL